MRVAFAAQRDWIGSLDWAPWVCSRSFGQGEKMDIGQKFLCLIVEACGLNVGRGNCM
jgi:hypothetical protein